MRTACTILVLVAVSYPCQSSGQQPTRFTASDKVVIDQLLDRYAQALSMRDWRTLREQLQVPFVRIPSGVEVMTTLDQVMEFFAALRADLDDTDFARGGFVRSRTTAISADRALVNKVFRRYRKDESVLLEQAMFYVVCKSSCTWKLCGTIALGPA